MSDQKPPEEPFDPYRPPPEGQQYGQPQQGQQPPYGQSQQWGQQPQPYGQFPQSYGAPGPQQKRSSKPLWFGALLGLIIVALGIWASSVLPDLAPYLFYGVLILTVVLLVVPVTRRWGLGILVGLALSIPLGLIIFAGLCLVFIASSSNST